jgi:hemoglobin-like flavoprotein
MTPAQLELVRASYATLPDGGAAMAADFYRNLFEIAPETRDLFATDPAVMAVKFSAELAAIVEAITSYETFAPRVRELAGRHVAYGVQPPHFRAVGQALIRALGGHLGESWDEDLEAAWRRAYNLVAELMMSVNAGEEAGD